MALSIKTQEADVLARRLVRLTGETITEAITIALRERLSREEARRAEANDLPARLTAFAERVRGAYDTHPVTKAEWDAASGDEARSPTAAPASCRKLLGGGGNPVWRTLGSRPARSACRVSRTVDVGGQLR